MSSISNIGLNDYLAAASAQAAEAAKLRAADGDIRSQIQRKAAQSGAAVTDLTYTTGPDGELYITGATVQALKRTVGTKTSLGIDDPRLVTPNSNQNNQSGQNAANDNRLARRAPNNFSDILPPQLNIDSLNFALLYEQKSNDDILQAKLQAADASTRSHESQHFFAAGGLVSGTPEYEFTQGPDGKLYATGGEVHVSTTPTNDPQKAARDAESFSIAATAPGDASTADLSIARNSYSKAAYSYAQTTRLGITNVLDMAA